MPGPAPEIVFDWDDENIAHLGRHRIVQKNSLRVAVLIFTIRNGKIRIITGWDADRKTKKAYFAGRGT